MKKYIKPECEISEVEFENSLMAGSVGNKDEVGDGKWSAPRHDTWNEEDGEE